MDTHARALHGMPSSLFRTQRLSRLHAENQGKSPRCVEGQRPFLRGRICASYGDLRWGIFAQEKSPQTSSRPLAHQEQATRRDVAPIVLRPCGVKVSVSEE